MRIISISAGEKDEVWMECEEEYGVREDAACTVRSNGQTRVHVRGLIAKCSCVRRVRVGFMGEGDITVVRGAG